LPAAVVLLDQDIPLDLFIALEVVEGTDDLILLVGVVLTLGLPSFFGLD
jgi:hypothetical protein